MRYSLPELSHLSTRKKSLKKTLTETVTYSNLFMWIVYTISSFNSGFPKDKK